MKQRVRTHQGVVVVPTNPVCRLCKKETVLNSNVEIDGAIVCFACSWKIMERLSKIYAAPEITALERVRHRNQHGSGLKKPKQNHEPGWVYYIRIADKIKIGYAVDVAKRMRAYPPNAELLAAHPGTPDLERQIHKRFAEHLSHGREWFDTAQPVMDHIASVVTQFGDQSHLAYQYTKPKTQEEKVAAMFATREHVDIARGAHSAV